MKNSIIAIVALLFTFVSYADEGDIVTNITPLAKTWTSKYDTMHVKIIGLNNVVTESPIKSLQSEVDRLVAWSKKNKLTSAQKKALTKAKKSIAELSKLFPKMEEESIYKRQSSRGPKWQKKAIDVLESKHDFYEAHTYWGERLDVEYLRDVCGFPEESIEQLDNHYIYEEGYTFSWESVKNKKGSSKSVFYIVTWHTELTDGNVTCSVPEESFAFLNKLEKGKPVYLGHLEN